MIEHRMSNSARVDAEGRPITLEATGNAWPRLRPSRSSFTFRMRCSTTCASAWRASAGPTRSPDAGWQYGTNLRVPAGDSSSYWRDGFDWRAQEAALNALPASSRSPLGGIDLHFIHAAGRAARAPMPLLLSHGWPGSVWEFHELIPLLTDPARFGGDPADAFTVVAPSLPGYALSFQPGQPRFGVVARSPIVVRRADDRRARLPALRRPGRRLGRFVVRRASAARHPERRWSASTSTCCRSRRDSSDPRAEFDRRRSALPRASSSTGRRRRPATSGSRARSRRRWPTALTDSPAGLAAWIVEKFQAWSDCDGDPFERWLDRDALLTNIMLYWVTGAISSSFWPYYAIRTRPWPMPEGDDRDADRLRRVPARDRAIRRARSPRAVYNIQRWTEFPRGGHYAALEVPDVLADDVAAFFRTLRQA